MPQNRFPKSRPRQTNLDQRPPRPYRLTPKGLASLRQAARRNSPWQWSTGPKTPGGKARSRLNATKHGQRSAERRAAQHETAVLLRALRSQEREQEPPALFDLSEPGKWVAR